MTNVSSRARTVEQPRGGYINPKIMERVQFEDGITLNRESIAPITMGMIVDYLTRMDQGSSPEDAFHIGLRGAEMAGREEEGKGYVDGIKGLDDESINNACRIVWFDQVVRAGRIGDGEPTDTFANPETCENVRTMVARARAFFEKYGPVVEDAPTFMGGYTKTVNTGDGDFVTEDTFWDFKVSKNVPTKENTLQLAMYFIMGHHSVWPNLQKLTKIGIFNPRLNAAFILDMDSLDPEIIKNIERDVICYTD